MGEICKFIEYASMRDLVTKSASDPIEEDVLDQISLLSIELFGEDCVETYGAPGKAGRLWAMYDFGGPLGDKRDQCASMASMSTEPSVCDGDEDDNEADNSSQAASDAAEKEGPAPGYGGRPRLLGFLVARLMNNVKMPRIGGEALSVVYAGVPEQLRGKGIGKKLVQSMVATGRERKNIAVITLSALPGAIDFWTRCGFVAFPDAMELKEGMAPGQVYMEANVRGSGKKGKRCKTNKKKPMFM